MKKNVIALLLAVVMASGSIVPVSALAAETTAEAAVAVEGEIVEEATDISEETDAVEIPEMAAQEEAAVEEKSAEDSTEISEDVASDESDKDKTETALVEETEEEPEQDSTESVEETEVIEESSNDRTESVSDDEAEEYVDEETEDEGSRDPAMAGEGEVIASGDCSATEDDHVTWTLTGTEDEMTLTISGQGNMIDYSYSGSPWSTSSGSIKNLIIVDEVTGIGAYAFVSCSSLTSITISDSVTSIGRSAFISCSSLTSITIPDSVTSISNEAFKNCKKLSSITIPNSVTSIGFDAFYLCSSLTSITIPDSVLSIGAGAFTRCSNLESITIPSSVTSIGAGAFLYCSSLKDVYYQGREEGWNAIEIGNNNECLTNATIHFNDKKQIEAEISQNLYYFDGTAGNHNEVKPQPVVTSGGTSLFENKDYTVEYKDNTSPGKATVIVTGTGDYAGTVEIPFYLATANGIEEAYEYTGERITPTFTLITDKKLQEGVDYTASYGENTKPGKECPCIIVNGAGDYSGKLTIPFIIKPRAITQQSSKTGVQREINIKFEEHPCADGYIVEWRYEEDDANKAPEHREINAESLTIMNGGSDEAFEITTDEEGNRWCEYHGDSMPRAKHAIIQVWAYAEVNMPDGTVNIVKSDPSTELTVATGNQVIRKEMWGFTNIQGQNSTRQVNVSGESHAEIYAQMTINREIGQCFGMCWSGAYSVQYGNSFGAGSLQNITSFENAAGYTDSTLGMSAQDAIAYAQAIQQANINMDEWSSAYLGENINNAVGNRSFFQQFYDRVKACQSGNDEPIIIALNRRGSSSESYKHALLAMGISYEDERVVEIDVYDPNCGNEETEKFRLYKDNGSLIGDNASFAYTASDNTFITGRLSDYDQFLNAPADFWIMPVNQNLRELLDQVRDEGILSFEDSLLFSYVPETQEQDYTFEVNEGDESIQIVPSYSPDNNQLIFRVSSSKGKKLFFLSRKATIKFGIRNIEYEISLKINEPCEIEITIDNPSYPRITINDIGTGQDIGWLERRFVSGSVETSRFSLVAGANGTISISPQPDKTSLFSGVSAISAMNLNGTYDGSGTVSEEETTTMPVIELSDSGSYSYSLYNNNPLLKQMIGDESGSSAIVFHVHDWSKWNTTKEPTLDVEGTVERNCSLCGEKETQNLNRLVNIKTANVTGLSDKTYTGKACTQSLTVILNGEKLVNDTDYTVSYSNNVSVGTASVIIAGKGNYGGTITKAFTITPKPISNLTITGIAGKTYNGTVQTQAVVVKDGNTTLTNGTHYTVAYKNNTNAGTASVVIAGKGNYGGSVTKTFTISKAANAITAKSFTKTYSTKAQSFSLGAKAKGGTLTYASNNKYVTVTKAGKVTIKAKYVGRAVITITAQNSNYNKATKKVTVTVKPTKTALLKVTSPAKSKMAVNWKKNTSGGGYQIQYATDSKFTKNKKTVTVKGSAKIGRTITGLTRGKKYYVRIRTYKTVSKVNFYSAWSSAKTVMIKK